MIRTPLALRRILLDVRSFVRGIIRVVSPHTLRFSFEVRSLVDECLQLARVSTHAAHAFLFRPRMVIGPAARGALSGFLFSSCILSGVLLFFWCMDRRAKNSEAEEEVKKQVDEVDSLQRDAEHEEDMLHIRAGTHKQLHQVKLKRVTAQAEKAAKAVEAAAAAKEAANWW
jgi:hypothetical protein